MKSMHTDNFCYFGDGAFNVVSLVIDLSVCNYYDDAGNEAEYRQKRNGYIFCNQSEYGRDQDASGRCRSKLYSYQSLGIAVSDQRRGTVYH